MVSKKSVEKQLKRLKFNSLAWGKSEIAELPHILMEDENIFECVNGAYEGGFALLVATNVRLILIDKKPLKFLTVGDMRYDMITELDYSHRLLGAQISISAGSKSLCFRSYNQPRLRTLISHVQHSMAESKKKQSESQQDQGQHLAQINQQLQAYLLAQYQQQESLKKQLDEARSNGTTIKTDNPEPVKPAPELADYLYAQSLLTQHEEGNPDFVRPQPIIPAPATATLLEPMVAAPIKVDSTHSLHSLREAGTNPQLADLYAEGMQEIFGRRNSQPNTTNSTDSTIADPPGATAAPQSSSIEINDLKIAYSKLPMALRNRKFGRPSFHAHSQSQAPATGQVASSIAS